MLVNSNRRISSRLCWRHTERLVRSFLGFTFLTHPVHCWCNVYRYAKLQMFEKNVLKFIVDWERIRLGGVNIVFSCSFHPSLMFDSMCLFFSVSFFFFVESHLSTIQEIGWEELIPNDLFWVEWDAKRLSLSVMFICLSTAHLQYVVVVISA